MSGWDNGAPTYVEYVGNPVVRESRLGRAESFNALNTPLFGGPNGSITSSAFGVISSESNSPRQNQMALKIRF